MAEAALGGGRAATARRVSTAALALAVLTALVVASAGVGYRTGVWGLGPAFTIVRTSLYVAIVIGVTALICLALSAMTRTWTGVTLASIALLVAIGTAAVPVAMWRAAKSAPFIHDITTDTEQPPEFVALRQIRLKSPNGAAYGGPAVAAQQKAGYPDLGPLLLRVPPAQALTRAEAAARALGWEIAAVVPTEGRLEATDTTRWFHFKDDVVVRVAPALDGSQVDVRSVSRVGRSDLGVNAKRVRAFLAALRASDSQR